MPELFDDVIEAGIAFGDGPPELASNPKCMSTTPKPSRMVVVDKARPPSTASDAGHAERPSRKWCSTAHAVWNPSLSANWMRDRFVVGRLLGPRCP